MRWTFRFSSFFLPEISSEGNLGQKKERALALGVTLAIIALLIPATHADAELVTFTDGRILKAADAYLDGATIVIELRGGGSMRVPATRVERVIADEVDDVPDPIPEFTNCPWVWDGEGLPEGIPYSDQILIAAARNLGADLDAMTTANFDMIRHYRPRVNVVTRPVAAGRGFEVVGHHEVILPLLRQAVIEALAAR